MGWAVQVPLDPEGLTSRFDWYHDAASFAVNEETRELTLLSANDVIIARTDKWSSFFETDEDPNTVGG